MQADLWSTTPEDVARVGIAAARAAIAGADRDAGIAQADANAPDAWKDEALAFIESYLHRHAELFCDDLWEAGLPKPPNPKALGPVLLKAVRLGLMEKSGEYRPSVSSHLIPKPVWRSLVCVAAPSEENPHE